MDNDAPASSHPTAENRKLAAVMFADIQGYTALFQDHEDAALRQIATHRLDLQSLVARYHGHVIKYYGDGSLTVFSSIVEALDCAIAIQQTSASHSIPLRIGLHLGELIEKENDVYGDSVNVASRIQSIGVPGSILVSKAVVDELKNHPHISFYALGAYALKNVRRPVEIFAVQAKGLTVPTSLETPRYLRNRNLYYWLGTLLLVGIIAFFITNSAKQDVSFQAADCFIVMPFRAHDDDPRLANFSQTIASYIGKCLREAAGVHIINERTLSYYTNATVTTAGISPTIARKAGARYAIEGDYSLEGKNSDTIRIWMTITDIKTNSPIAISIPDITCHIDSKMECVKDASNVLAGYWRSKKDYLFQFTNDSAYTAYRIAQEKWGNPDLRTEVKQYLIKAITYDPKFIDAWFLLLDWFYNKNEFQSAIDTISLIRQNFPSLDARKQDYLNFYSADFAGNRKLAFDYFYKEYQQNKYDLFTNTSGMVMAMEYLNDPQLAISLFQQIHPDSIDFSTCNYCMSRFNIALQAYTATDQFDKAAEAAARLQPYATRSSQFVRLIDYYIAVSDTIAVNDIILQGVKTSTYADDEPYYCLFAARAAALRHDTILRNQYAQRILRFYGDSINYESAKTYLLIHDIPNAVRSFESLVRKFPDDPRPLGLLGVAYARQGDTVRARQMMLEVGKLKTEFDYGETPYMQARIAANLGDRKQALALCKTALTEGLKFRPSLTFRQDPEMLLLHDDPAFIALENSLRFKM